MTAPTPSPDVNQLMLRFARQDITLAVMFAALYPDNYMDFLMPLAASEPRAALMVAERLPTVEAIEVLLPHVQHADVAERAHELIKDYDFIAAPHCVAQGAADAILAAQDMPPEEALAVLGFYARYESFAAVALSRRLPTSQAIAVLTPHAERNTYVAESLKQLTGE